MRCDYEHDAAYERACQWDEFVEARTLVWLEEVEATALTALEKHPAIFLAFDDKASYGATIFADYVETLENWPTGRVVIGTETDYHDLEEYFPDIIRETHIKVAIDFAPDLDPESDFDPPEPWNM